MNFDGPVRHCAVIVGPMKLAITVDKQATRLYLDGLLTSLSNPNDWTKVDVIDIPADTRVIAVRGRNEGVSFKTIHAESPLSAIHITLADSSVDRLGATNQQNFYRPTSNISCRQSAITVVAFSRYRFKSTCVPSSVASA